MVRGKHVYRSKRVFALALKLAQGVEEKGERKRGRPPWYMRKKLGEGELHKLLSIWKEKLRPFLEKSPLLTPDSTGIP